MKMNNLFNIKEIKKGIKENVSKDITSEYPDF